MARVPRIEASDLAASVLLNLATGCREILANGEQQPK